VTNSAANTLEYLIANASTAQHWQFGRGIEKESLRIDMDGNLSMREHPHELGSALSHPQITTDFSEALLELITGVHTRIDDALGELFRIHQYVYSVLEKQGEMLWTNSMPCVLNDDSGIPIANYGSSNVAKMKQTYRKGLGHRYGRAMQAIAGIHYNWSAPEGLWDALIQKESYTGDRQAFITNKYLGLIRNFRRHSWLLYMLLGASPALCRTFLGDSPHKLDKMGRGTLFAEHATTLRMGDLGYTSDAQSSLNINYNDLDSYIATLKQGLTTKAPEYANIGVKVDGEYRQLSDAILQIENEFYSPIRPKRVASSGETPIRALLTRGIEYIEVRCVDLNPFNALGIERLQAHFIDAFLLSCLLNDSELETSASIAELTRNTERVVNNGRDPELVLCDNGVEKLASTWALELCDQAAAAAQLLDSVEATKDFSLAVHAMKGALEHPSHLPSAKVMQSIREQGDSFSKFGMHSSKNAAEFFLQSPLSLEQESQFHETALKSLETQVQIEASDRISFDEYLANYYAQY